VAELGKDGIGKQTEPLHRLLQPEPGLLYVHRLTPATDLQAVIAAMWKRQVEHTDRVAPFQTQHAAAKLDLAGSARNHLHFHVAPQPGRIAAVVKPCWTRRFPHPVDEQPVDVTGFGARDMGHHRRAEYGIGADAPAIFLRESQPRIVNETEPVVRIDAMHKLAAVTVLRHV